MYKFLVTQYNQGGSQASLTKVPSIESDTSDNSSPTSVNEYLPQEPEYNSDGQENYFRNKRETVFGAMPGRLSSSANNLELPRRKTTKAIQHPVSNHVQDVVSSSPPPPSYLPPSPPSSSNTNNNTIMTKLQTEYPHVDITSKALYKILDFMTDIESSLIEQAVQFATEAQKANQSENQDGKITISSQDVRMHFYFNLTHSDHAIYISNAWCYRS